MRNALSKRFPNVVLGRWVNGNQWEIIYSQSWLKPEGRQGAHSHRTAISRMLETEGNCHCSAGSVCGSIVSAKSTLPRRGKGTREGSLLYRKTRGPPDESVLRPPDCGTHTAQGRCVGLKVLGLRPLGGQPLSTGRHSYAHPCLEARLVFFPEMMFCF